jgi:DNA-binding response OmpR family regulator
MVSAKALIDDIDAALLAGASAYLVKPFRSGSLKATINEVFEDQKNGVQS